MTDRLKREIERLLGEPGEPPVAGQEADRVRAALAATFSEGLADPSVAAPGADAGNPAAIAAFIDGRLAGAARAEFASALAQQPGLRADVESAADLVAATADSAADVPKHLLARARAQFAPAPPAAKPRSGWTFSFTDLLPRQRIALAMAAVLAVAVIIPTGMMISSRFGEPGGEPELSGVDPDTEAERLQACKDRLKDAQAKSKTATPAPKQSPDGSEPKDPCDPPEVKSGGALKK